MILDGLVKMTRENINDLATAKTLLKRELAIAMHLQLGRGPTMTLTLDEMMEMPSVIIPFAGSGQEMMDSLGLDGVKSAILEKMVSKIKGHYEYSNWEDALKDEIVYDDDHVVVLSEYITADMLV